jgi:ABC-type branched-subunit amino acid transport system ATPase component
VSAAPKIDAVARPAAPLLQVRDIEKTFPGVLALSGVSFEVRAGEVHALLGENGAGKLGKLNVINGSEILLGPPYIFNKDNISKFDF